MKTIKKSIILMQSTHHGGSVSSLEVDLGSVLESELGQKWRSGALKACIG